MQRTLDVEGRLLEEKQGDFVIANVFDALGRRLRRETSAGNVIAYEYDVLGQPTAIRINDEAPITIERDEAGQVVKETLSPSLERQYQYDAEGRLTGQGVRREAEWLFSTQYAYDSSGNLTHRKDSQYGLDQFRYDPLGQIVEHIDPQGRLKRFFQDPAGDRLTTGVKQAEGGPWRREGWCEGVHYRFDAAGNLIERRDERQLEAAQAAEVPKTLSLEWDANQRLVRSRARSTFGHVLEETATDYGYDPLGRRVFKRTGVEWSRFGWDGDSLVVEESTRRLREYVYYPGGFVPLAMVDGGDSYRYHTDRNGSPTRLTAVDGTVVWAARYEAWGRASIQLDTVENPIRLQGQYEDRETGLHYNLCRYFDTGSGAFISPDLLKLAAGVNLYKFAPNALVWIDPLGLSPLDIGQIGKHGHPINSRVEYGDNIAYLVEGSKPSTRGRLVGWHYYENPGHHDPNRNDLPPEPVPVDLRNPLG